jgi:hypothetical protein
MSEFVYSIKSGSRFARGFRYTPVLLAQRMKKNNNTKKKQKNKKTKTKTKKQKQKQPPQNKKACLNLGSYIKSQAGSDFSNNIELINAKHSACIIRFWPVKHAQQKKKKKEKRKG